MKDKKKIINSLEVLLDMLPGTLTDEEKHKVEEIKALLVEIEKKDAKEKSMDR